MSFENIVDVLAHFRDSLPMTCNIRYSQPSDYIALANPKVVDISTSAPFAGHGVDRPNDFSSRDFYISIADATPNPLTLEPGIGVSDWDL
ncbi:MAG: hypothetical protein HKP41_08220 [Desulfobacterales bacterium]|nr:hypothetical protein [Desulfobacterales bacterium]